MYIKLITIILILFTVSGCSFQNSKNTEISHKENSQSYQNYDYEQVIQVIQNAHSGIIYHKKTIEEMTKGLAFEEFPNISTFITNNTGTYVIGLVPYVTASGSIEAYEVFMGCSDERYCASFYIRMSESPSMEYDKNGNLVDGGMKIFSHTLRVRKGASPTLHLAKLLGSTHNQYFHGQYAMRLSDRRVASLDPLDIDIVDASALFRRMEIMNNPDITELTKLVHDRYYLSGGLTSVGAMHMDFGSGDEIFTGVLERNPDIWNVPTRINGRFIDPTQSYSKSNMQVCYDTSERQLFYTGTTKPHGTIEHACGVNGWSNNDGTAMYVGLARLFGTVSFDQIMSRTTGVILSESPWKMPCMTIECPEDNEFIYEIKK